MPIAETDLVFLESERLDDSANGGGRMTGNVIPDGQENNLFPDIAPTDRIIGRTRLRKGFAANRATDTSLFLGAHVLLSEVPADANVSVTLFSTADWTDTRDAAREYVERYLARSGYWPANLYGNHLAGQKALQLVSLVGVETPNVGQTLVLIQDEGTEDEIEQYVRITRVESAVQTFVDANGEFQRLVILAEISDALRTDFAGLDPNRYTSTNARTVLRDTIAAAAARYYSARPLADAALVGDRTIYVDSIYTQLVPSAQTETPLADVDAAGAAAPLMVCGGTLSLTTSAPLSSTARLYLSAGIEQGSLTIATGGATLTDDGRGNLLSGGIAVGAIDYTEGTVVGLAGGPEYPAEKVCAWTPVAAPAAVGHTAGIDVTAESRSLNVVLTLLPIPRPGTLRVDYRAGGKWYRLADRGDGGLAGVSSAHGAGSLNFTTGTAMVTCGALPDVGSTVIFVWAIAQDTWNRSAETFDPPKIVATLAHGNVVPNSLDLAWTVNSIPKTASDNGSGLLTGDATGTINYATGELVIVPGLLPQQGTEIAVDYQYGPPKVATFTAPTREGDGSLALTLPDTNLVAGSVAVSWNLTITDYQDGNVPAEMAVRSAYASTKTASDNGSGALVISGGVNGTINYSAGTLAFSPDVTVGINKPVYALRHLGTFRHVFDHFETGPADASMPDTGGLVTVRYRIAGGEGSASETVTVGNLVVDLTKGFAEALVPNALRFLLGIRTYVDRAGSLYYDIDPATGAGTLGGVIDYGSGRATLSAWSAHIAPQQALKTMLTRLVAPVVDEILFRIAIAPVRPGSLSISATPVLSGGSAINLTANTDGTILSAGVADGTVDYQTGVVRIRWGGWVADSSLSPEDKLEVWYDEDARVMLDGVLKIFRPRPVYADTVKYNAVGYSYLPLSADLLGLDPVRLPSDGRVPCLVVGDVVVVQHSTTHSVATPVAGGTVDTELTAVARVRVYDTDGDAVPPDRYSLAQDTGIVTWATPLDLSEYSGPYAVKAWIEDAALVIDADISGRLALNLALTHDYPEGALVASAFVHGDLYAQISTPFSQQAWTAEWSDERIGDPILAQYNSLLYPIELSNAASWRERWVLIFTSATSFRVIGETLGEITNDLGGSGFHDVDHDLAPVNPLTGTPYFTLPWEGWGSGWVAGNLLRFNLLPPANFPFWLAMTVQPSPPTTGLDRFALLLRGGIDA